MAKFDDRGPRRITYHEETQQIYTWLIGAIILGVLILGACAVTRPAPAGAAARPTPTPTACRVVAREPIMEGVERVTCANGTKQLYYPPAKPRQPQRVRHP